MEEQSITHLWLSLTTAIVGLIVGYTLVILQQEHPFAVAHSGMCPLQQECQNGHCNAAGCNDRNCEACPGGCQRKAS